MDNSIYWQGVEGFLPINNQQPSTQSFLPMGIPGFPTSGQMISPNAGMGNMTSVFGTPGIWGGGYGGGYGGQGGGYGEGVAQGAGLTGSAFGSEGPGLAGTGLIGPAQASPNQAANIVGSILGLAKGGIIGPVSAIAKGATNAPPSMFDSLVYDALSFISGYPDLATQQANFDITMDQIGPLAGSSTGFQGTTSEDAMGGYAPGPGFGTGGNASGAGLSGSPFGGADGGGAAPGK